MGNEHAHHDIENRACSETALETQLDDFSLASHGGYQPSELSPRAFRGANDVE